ncbi:MAG: DUF5067 domain-containing protein [Eubacteriales bacterium]|nr:DUF5067 domain-containing protein [Eubacteriales bacterium]
MDNQNFEEAEAASLGSQKNKKKKKKKKSKTGLVLLLVLLILAAAGCVAGYLYLRQKPQKAAEQFLSSIQRMDLPAMEAMLQSNDLSALDDADIRNQAYADFFKTINGKMTFQIVRNDFDISGETARITARIRYIDGSEIYKETVSEFLRQIVSSAFSGESLTEEETQQRLASILNEKAASLEDRFSETDILYPMIKADGQWKVVSLDDETVRIMSANIKSVEEEIQATIDDTSQEAQAPSPDGQEAAGTSVDMTTERFTIHYTRHQVANDFAQNPCLLVYYDYTNNGSSASSAMVDVRLLAYQNGQTLDAAIPETNDEAVDRFMSEVQPGETVSVCQAFSLVDRSDVTLTAGDAFHFNGETSSQLLTLE